MTSDSGPRAGAPRSSSLRAVAVPAVLAVLLLVTACSGGGDEAAPTPSTSATPTAPAPPTATEVPRPDRDGCYRLNFDEAVSPTSGTTVRDCDRVHTAQTYEVGRVDNLVDGHLLAIDSDRVQDGVAETCTGSVAEAVGGDEDQLRLSMLRAVWFTPTLEESDAGADWYRCDVVALRGSDRLTPLRTSLLGTLGTQAGRDEFGMCGTAAPDAPDFERVPCRLEHSWRAVSVVDLPAGDFPGEAAARSAGQQPCEDAGRERAADPLDFDWGYEFPDAEQWSDGMTFGRCWVPD